MILVLLILEYIRLASVIRLHIGLPNSQLNQNKTLQIFLLSALNTAHHDSEARGCPVDLLWYVDPVIAAASELMKEEGSADVNL